MCGGDPPPPSDKDKAQVAKFNRELAEQKDKFGKGPIQNRSCTDVICCLVFIVAIVGFGAATAYGLSAGDPKKLLIGWDSDGNGCGYSEATKDYPVLFWAEPPGTEMVEAVKTFDYEKVLKLLNTGVCVRDCPSDGVIECKPTTRMTSSALQGNNFDGCVYKLDANYFDAFLPDQATKEAYINKYYPGGYSAYQNANNPYVPFAYESTKLYGFCVPDLNTDEIGALGKETLETFKKLFEETIMNDKMTSYISDIAFSWKVLAICSGTSLVLGYLYLLFIRLCGCVIVWLSIVLIQVSLIGSAVYVYMESENYAEDHDYHTWLKYASYVLAGIAGLFLCCICCCWNAIRIGIAVYQTTA